MIRRLLSGFERDLVLTREAAPRELDRQPSRRQPTPPTPPPPQRPPAQPFTDSDQAPSARASLLHDLSTRAGVRRAVLLSEILGPPVALRPPGDGPSGGGR